MISVRPTWAIVPAKSLLRGKSRLRPVLADHERTAFARRLLEHVLGVLGACELDGVLVATDGDDVAELTERRGAQVLRDSGEGSLATVVDRALAAVTARAARSAVVLMADLPRVEPRDVRELLLALRDHDVVLVRDHLGNHTNALAMTPPQAMATSFGHADSFAAHCAAAGAAKLRIAIVENERIAFDVDAPDDHARLTTPRREGGT
jgi:2-phospho-L-lactate guanylyltransferase